MFSPYCGSFAMQLKGMRLVSLTGMSKLPIMCVHVPCDEIQPPPGCTHTLCTTCLG